MGYFLDSWWNVIFVLVFGACVYLYDWSKNKLKYFDKSKIPYVKYNLKALLIALLSDCNFDEGFNSMYSWFPESRYFGYFEIFRPSLMIRDPDLIRLITQSNFSQFRNRWHTEVDVNLDPLTANLVNLSGDKWKELRNKLNPGFTPSKLQWMFPLMQGCATSLTQKLRKNWNSCEEDVDAKLIFSEYTLATIVSCGFGIDPDSVKNKDSEFKKMLKKSTETSLQMMIKFLIKMSLPLVSSVIILRTISEDIEDYFVGIAKSEFVRRQTQGIKRTDFVQFLMEIKEKGQMQYDPVELEDENIEKLTNSDLEWTDEFLTSQMLAFLQAGYESSSTMLAVSCYHISKNRKIQDRIRKEINQAKEKYNILNYQALKEISLLDHCMSESMRLFPSSGTIIRVCTEDFQLDDGNVIEEGTNITIPVAAIQKDEKYWTNPNSYDPDRFTRDSVVPGTFLPFGLGPRACIGQRFALLQAKLLIVRLLEKFILIPSPMTKEPLRKEKLFDMNVVGGVFIRLQPVEH